MSTSHQNGFCMLVELPHKHFPQDQRGQRRMQWWCSGPWEPLITAYHSTFDSFGYYLPDKAKEYSYVLRQPFVLCTKDSTGLYKTIRELHREVRNGSTVYWICESYARLENPAACSQLKIFHQVCRNDPVRVFKWQCDLGIKDLPRRFDFTHFDKSPDQAWNVGSLVYPAPFSPHPAADHHLQMDPPDTLRLKCRWLCYGGVEERDKDDPAKVIFIPYMDEAVKAQFNDDHGAAGIQAPPSKIEMQSGFDYLEASFADLFGVWDPQKQTFSRAFPHPPDIEDLYRHSGWLPRILNRAFETLPPSLFAQNFHTVCPWSGAAIVWMEAEDERDMKFISLLRQSSTLPFAPMPKTISTEKSWRTSPGTVYAVFQPIEHISKRVLLDLEQSHRDRFQWQKMQRADFAKSMQRAVREGTAPTPATYDALAQPSPHQATYGVAASTWTLPEHDKIPITEEKDFQTGFLVHMVPIGRLMEWQYTFFRAGRHDAELRFSHQHFPMLKPMRELQPAETQVCAAIACDIDHTLINQALGFHGAQGPGTPWPGGRLPQLPSSMLDIERVKHYAAELDGYARSYVKDLRLTGWCERDKETHHERWGFEDLSAPVALAIGHVEQKRAIFIGPADRTFRCPKREGDAEPWFTPGSAEVDDPLRQTTNTTQHFYIIYPRRDLATLISACYPVVNGAVVMRYKPVFTTAGSQPYGDNVIAALKVLVLDWLKGRADDEVCASMAGALDSHPELATQQVNAFFRGPVVSMMYSRWLGPQVARDRDEVLHLSEVPSADKLDKDKQDKYRAVTKNFQRFLLFGALQPGGTLYDFSSMLTRRAAISLDDTREAWGEVDNALMVHVERAKLLSAWSNSRWESTVLFYMYMDALASHGAEVEFDPQGISGLQQFRLVPTAKSELAKASERLEALHDLATRQHVMTLASQPERRYDARTLRKPVLLDILLPVTRMTCDAHYVALEQEKRKVELAHTKIGQLKRRISALENRP